MTTAHGVYVTRHGGTEVLEVRDHPVGAPGEGEVRIRVGAAGLNFIDVYRRQGVYHTEPPFLLGEEGAGTVTEVGPGVERVAVGDRVAWTMSSGSMATEVVKPERALVTIPDGIGFDIAAATMLQGLTAHYLVRSTYRVATGDIALVHAAAGGVGQLLVQMITTLGATVVATAGGDAKLAVARERGAAHTIDYRAFDTPDALAAAVREAAGRGVDVAYDGVGLATFDASLRSLRPRGTAVLFGGASGQVPPFDLQQLNALGSLFVTRPSLVHYVADPAEYAWRAEEVFSAITTGRLDIAIGGRYRLDDVARGYDALESRASTGKLIVEL